jgi:hypothetical protein
MATIVTFLLCLNILITMSYVWKTTPERNRAFLVFMSLTSICFVLFLLVAKEL